MVISFRVSTVAALFIGLSFGILTGAIGAQQIAKHWPEFDIFDSVVRLPAPSPLFMGKSADGEAVLCDKDGFAYELVDYGYKMGGGRSETDESEGLPIYRAWTGLQELKPLLKPSTGDDETLYPLKAMQQKCQ